MKIELNTQGRDFVVGDIHGCFSKLKQSLDAIGFTPEVDRLFSVGDLVDRGPESEEALNWLTKPWFFAVRGNHDQMAIDAANGRYSRDAYIYNGGRWFLNLTKIHQQLFADAFEELPLWMEIETKGGLVGLVHADVPNNWDHIETFPEFQMLWGRDRIAIKDTTVIKNIHKVYVGHTPVKEKVILGNVHYIDTGACFGKEFHIEQL